MFTKTWLKIEKRLFEMEKIYRFLIAALVVALIGFAAICVLSYVTYENYVFWDWFESAVRSLHL